VVFSWVFAIIKYRPARSGTTVHIDPLHTSAWNTSLQGHKLWVLFPPHIPKSVVKGKGLLVRGHIRSDDVDEAIDWFLYVLPKIIQTEGAGNLEIM
jgi:histone arginine demethylase JMJD6